MNLDDLVGANPPEEIKIISSFMTLFFVMALLQAKNTFDVGVLAQNVDRDCTFSLSNFRSSRSYQGMSGAPPAWSVAPGERSFHFWIEGLRRHHRGD